MNTINMYELAKDAVAAYVHAGEGDPAPDVLWVGGLLEDRRAVVWYGERLFMVFYNTVTQSTTVQPYVKENVEAEG